MMVYLPEPIHETALDGHIRWLIEEKGCECVWNLMNTATLFMACASGCPPSVPSFVQETCTKTLLLLFPVDKNHSSFLKTLYCTAPVCPSGHSALWLSDQQSLYIFSTTDWAKDWQNSLHLTLTGLGHLSGFWPTAWSSGMLGTDGCQDALCTRKAGVRYAKTILLMSWLGDCASELLDWNHRRDLIVCVCRSLWEAPDQGRAPAWRLLHACDACNTAGPFVVCWPRLVRNTEPG